MNTKVKSNTMILSKKTLDILKNFASINTNICIQPGSKLITLSPTMNIMAEAVVEEKFGQDVRIPDLNDFLTTISIAESSELSFEEEHILVGNGDRAEFPYGDPAIVKAVTKKLTMPDIVATIELSHKQLAKIMKASGAQRLPNLKIRSAGDGTAEAVVFDKSLPKSITHKLVLDAEYSEPFSVSFKVDALKFIPGDYTLEISKNIVSRFTHKTEDIKYFVAMDYKPADEDEQE